ncbi:MAG: ABC transporter permease [Thiohalospira sp.]
MELIRLTPWDLGLAALLVLALAGLSTLLGLGIGRRFVIATLRMAVQLALVGLVLEALFTAASPWWLLPVAGLMLAVAGREVAVRQPHRFRGGWGYGLGTLSMFIAAFSVTALALAVIIQPEPWHEPQYAIPLLGMLLGNTMNGVALGLERLTTAAVEQRAVIEQRLMLGEDRSAAVAGMRRDAMRVGMVPVINAMAAAGVVSLPGMMTGQILSGTAPAEAVKYQILIMLLIAVGTGLGTLAAVTLGARRLFDERHRLRLERLR